MDKIYLDEKGYQNYLKELEQIRKKININSKDISEFQSDDAYGDGWHDNFAYEQAIQKENALFFEYQKKLKGLDQIEIIKIEKKGNLVEIGSIVELRFDGELETEVYKVTGNTVSNFKNDQVEITLNSPLGKNIFHKKINDSFSYQVDNRKISGKIIDIK